jgi:hypothetical protein
VPNASFPAPMYRSKADPIIVPSRGEVRFIDKGKATERVNNTRGPSLNMDLLKLLAQFQEAREVLSIPDTLKIEHVPTRDNPLHYEVMPREPYLTFSQFVSECAKIELGPIMS